MSIVAHSHPYVIGVDAHARTHALAILAGPHGELLDEAQFPARPAGLHRALAWAGRRTGGDLDALWVVEGIATYGSRVARTAAAAGYLVVEAANMNARANRGVGKSDPLDARRIAQAVLPIGDRYLRHPRLDEGVRAAIRVLIASRDHISTERTAAVNALISLLRAVDLGVDARSTLNATQLTAIAAWRTRSEPLANRVARAEATRLAKRVRTADQELSALTRQRSDLLATSPAAGLLEQPGIGPVTAAIAYAAWSHPGRVRCRSSVRQPRRRQPHPRLIRKHHPPPHQPRRRPATQPSPAHGGGHPDAHGPRDPHLRSEAHRARTQPP